MTQDVRTLSPETIAAIERDLLIETPLAPADLLFVFGTHIGVPEFLEVIEGLWQRRLFNWVLVSGGVTGNESRTEAEILAEGMIALGVPPERIILEEAATNTGENVIYSLPIIDRHLGLSNVSSLIAVGKYYSSARYLMTLERHWPTVTKMLAPVHFHPHPREDWPHHPLTRQKVLSEWRKLEAYQKAGFIAPWRPRKRG